MNARSKSHQAAVLERRRSNATSPKPAKVARKQRSRSGREAAAVRSEMFHRSDVTSTSRRNPWG